MDLHLHLSPANIIFLKRYLPHLTATLMPKLVKEDTVLVTNRKELENLQKALSEVLMTYGFNENYDANAVGQQAEDLMDSIQAILKS